MKIENTDEMDMDIKRMLELAEQAGGMKKEFELSGTEKINGDHPYITVIGELEELKEKYGLQK